MHRSPWRLAVALVLIITACHPDFQLKKYSSNEALYQASLRQFERKKWENAIEGFDKLTTDLSQRDTLLPLAFWYLGESHDRVNEHLLAADAFNHLATSFQDDTLAQQAELEAARSYRKMWRRPALTSDYGQTAIQSYQTLLTFYPNSKLVPLAKKELLDTQNWFAIKNYDIGAYYYHLNLFDAANIYLKSVLDVWSDTPKAKDAGLLLIDSYRKIKYLDDAADVCGLMRTKYPDDTDVKRKCPLVPGTSAPAKLPHP